MSPFKIFVSGDSNFLLPTITTLRNNSISETFPVVDCSSYHRIPNLTYGELCHFINETGACQPDDGFLNYLKFIHCSLAGSNVPYLWPLLFILVILWLIFLIACLGLAADEFLCPALKVIHKQLKLSENLVGVTFVAFGNGAPDIFGSIAAIGGQRPQPGMAFGALFGAGIFVTTVVVGAIAVINPFHPMERPLLRDVVFYIFTITWTYRMLYESEVSITDAAGFIGLYVIYVLVVVIGRRINLYCRKKNDLDASLSVPASVSPEPYCGSPSFTASTPSVVDGPTESAEWETGRDDSYPPAVHPGCYKDFSPAAENSVLSEDPYSPALHPISDENVLPVSRQLSQPAQDTFEDSQLPVVHCISLSGQDLYSPPSFDRVMSVNLESSASPSTPFFATNSLSVESDDRILPIDADDEPLLGTDDATVSSVDEDKKSSLETTSFMASFSPLGMSTEEWRESRLWTKIYTVAVVPMRLLIAATIPSVEYDGVNGKLKGWNQWSFALRLLLMPSMIALLIGQPMTLINSMFPVWALALLIGFILCVTLIAVTSFETTPRFFFLFSYLAFAMSVLWIYTLANEVVDILSAVGVVADIGVTVLGLTVLAWGNSIGDFVTDCALARAGNSRMALSACFAAPLFNTLLGFGIPFTIAIIKSDQNFSIERTDINAILLLTLATSLLFTFLWMFFSKFRVGRVYGACLFVLYLVFLALALLQEFKIISIDADVIFGS